MAQRKVKVTISPMGDSNVEAIGFQGADCEVATRDIEKALAGGGGKGKKLKPEYYQEGEEGQQVKQSW